MITELAPAERARVALDSKIERTLFPAIPSAIVGSEAYEVDEAAASARIELMGVLIAGDQPPDVAGRDRLDLEALDHEADLVVTRAARIQDPRVRRGVQSIRRIRRRLRPLLQAERARRRSRTGQRRTGPAAGRTTAVDREGQCSIVESGTQVTTGDNCDSIAADARDQELQGESTQRVTMSASRALQRGRLDRMVQAGQQAGASSRAALRDEAVQYFQGRTAPFTQRELEELLQVTRFTLLRYRQQGVLRAWVRGNVVRYHVEDVYDLLRSQTV
jgi:hypothetical protein